MASETPESKTLTAECYCKSTRFTITVPVSALPLGTHLCACFICRQVHGTFTCFHAPLPSGVTPQFLTSPTSITRYRHAEAASDRLFCSTCGCHIGDEDITPDHATGHLEWRVASSIFTDGAHADKSVFQIRSHIFTGDTSSVGFHTWLPRIGERELYIWSPEKGDPVFPIPPPQPPKQEIGEDGHERLRAECHCGGVSFTFPRPDHPSFKDNELVKRYTSPKDPSKWVACLDVCDDCRLLTGAHVTPWTFVPLNSLQPAVSSDLKGLGTLKTYRSSEKVLRGFCGCCGATVFYLCDEEERADAKSGMRMVDIAVGILRAPEGVIAERWLTWRTSRLTYKGDGMRFDPGFTEGLEAGLRAWGEKEHGEVLDFEIPML
ncbi:glutathione-dependent formaldehyde-activating enzyme [Cercophora newfieldiana]|uniref:Glutathione-dependent formaldehyde-activating enzyme n=1 Tax=Cercophora newfieldiana TaxID=92897 RepID=A0AA39XXF2_9PEZI|nr:glutathione-dependent formaldehyde-activating enzyme [Cercophora newfieldiana]